MRKREVTSGGRTEKFLSLTALSLCDMGHVPQFPHWGDGQDETWARSTTVRIKPDLGLEQRRLMRGQVIETARPRGWLVTGKEEKNLQLAPLSTTWSLGGAKCQGLFHRTLEALRSGEAQGHSTPGQGLWTGGLEPGSPAFFADSIPVLFCLLLGPLTCSTPCRPVGFGDLVPGKQDLWAAPGAGVPPPLPWRTLLCSGQPEDGGGGSGILGSGQPAV